MGSCGQDGGITPGGIDYPWTVPATLYQAQKGVEREGSESHAIIEWDGKLAMAMVAYAVRAPMETGAANGADASQAGEKCAYDTGGDPW